MRRIDWRGIFQGIRERWVLVGFRKDELSSRLTSADPANLDDRLCLRALRHLPADDSLRVMMEFGLDKCHKIDAVSRDPRIPFEDLASQVYEARLNFMADRLSRALRIKIERPPRLNVILAILEQEEESQEGFL